MILSGRMRQPGGFIAPKRNSLRVGNGASAPEQIRELIRVEREIEDANAKVKRMADELGVRYAVFRCDMSYYDNGRNESGTEIMQLSRQTDDCIQSIYRLEQRRRELLRRLGK